MIARPDSLRGSDPTAVERPTGTDRTSTPASESLGRRLRAAKAAVARLQGDAEDLVSLRKSNLAARTRRFLWRIATGCVLAFLGIVAATTAMIMTLLGAATGVAELLGVSNGIGRLIVGATLLVIFGAALAHGQRDRRAGARKVAEAATRADIRSTTRRLLRSVGTVPGMLISALLGFALVKLLRHRPLRRAALVGLSALRRANAASRPVDAA